MQLQKISTLPPPTDGIGICWGVRGSVRPKYLKKCTKLVKLNFQRGLVGVLEKIPSVGEGFLCLVFLYVIYYYYA